jgi:hypothetical protein
MRNLWHTFQLGLKELVSLWRDPVLLFLIAYVFTFSIYTPAKSAVMDVVNASIAIVNEDDSAVSREVRDAMLPPLFLPAAEIPFSDINRHKHTAAVPGRLSKRCQAKRSDHHRRNRHEPGGQGALVYPAHYQQHGRAVLVWSGQGTRRTPGTA